MKRFAVAVLMGCVIALVGSSPAQAAKWITPDFPPGQEQTFKPEALYWFTVAETPYVYRTEIDMPKDADRATFLLRTAGYVYVYVDGRLCYSWSPRAEDKKNSVPAEKADRSRVHGVDLSDVLTPGEHVLAVSAPKEGFVMDGVIHAAGKELDGPATSGTWTVTKLPPTTMIEDHEVMKLGYRGASAPVRAADVPVTGGSSRDLQPPAQDFLSAAHFKATHDRLNRGFVELWERCTLLAKGIYIDAGQARVWGGVARVETASWETLGQLFVSCDRFTADLAALWKLSAGNMGTVEYTRQLDLLLRRLDLMRDQANRLSRRLAAGDEAKALTLVSRAFAGPWPARVDPADTKMPAIRAEMEKQIGHPLPHLNESRYDRLGWVDHAQLTDSDISRWGIRVNPVTGPTKISGPRQWLFSTDPKNEGEKELRFSIGFNIENQWPKIEATRSWTDDKRFADYSGPAWYRARMDIPSEWAGNPVVLSVPIAGEARFWLNDQELTSLGKVEGGRVVYKLESRQVAFGENCLAFRIVGQGAKRGLLGTVEASCPALDDQSARQAPPVEVLATPLSPCVILTPTTNTIQIHHGGTARVFVPGSGRFAIEAGNRKAAGLGNWALVWLTAESAASAARPILLVFQHAAESITTAPGVLTIRLNNRGDRVITVRPWVKAAAPDPLADQSALVKPITFWSQAALAVPVNFMCITRVAKKGEDWRNISIDKIPAGPVLSHAYVYDYVETQDDWKTTPLKITPLPALCAYAVTQKFRGLKLDQNPEVLQDGGMLAPYQGIRGDRISYSYPIEPYPRLIGFTSWMFAGSDTGVPGNKREVELIKSTGANSYRPQHNFCEDIPPNWMFGPNEKRTRSADHDRLLQRGRPELHEQHRPDARAGSKGRPERL